MHEASPKITRMVTRNRDRSLRNFGLNYYPYYKTVFLKGPGAFIILLFVDDNILRFDPLTHCDCMLNRLLRLIRFFFSVCVGGDYTGVNLIR